MENDLKALKRKAKALLLSKDIPAGKMDIVRALLTNDRVLEEEKYRAIIDLISLSCLYRQARLRLRALMNSKK